MVGENRRALCARRRAGELFNEAVAVENVVAQHQGRQIITNERLPDDERLRQAVGTELNGILKVDAPARAVAKQLFEAWRILWCRDDQNIAYSRQHEGTERIIDHWLVEYRQQLLANGQGGGVKPGAGATSKNDPFAFHTKNSN